MTNPTLPKRTLKGQPGAGEFAADKKTEAPYGLLNEDRPMPELNDVVYLDGVWALVTHVDGRTAVIKWGDGSLELVTGHELGLDKGDEHAPIPMPPAAAKLPETQRQRRGHKFYPNMEKWPALSATEDVAAQDKTIVAHYFGPVGDWYIAEVDRESGTAFGYASLASQPGSAEWGYIPLPELEQLNVGPFVGVERDLDHNPKSKAKDVIKDYREAK
jgi:hypothetical protein